MKKIALVISTLQAGGGERVVATLSQEFAKNSDVSLIIFDDSNIDYEYGGELICIQCPDKQGLFGKLANILKRTSRLRKLYREKDFDFIFGFMESANYPSILADRNTIASTHIDPAFLSFPERLLLRMIYPLAKRVAPVSKDMAEVLETSYGLKNVTTIYNPVPVSELKKLADFSRPYHRKYILAVGRLTYQKHFDLLIDAYALSKAKQDCDLIILGEGELRGELEQQILKLGLNREVHVLGVNQTSPKIMLHPRVYMPGRLKDPFHYFKYAEFMALSSRAEGFPMVLIEALTLGCPVLSVDCPTGPREIVKHEHNGLLIESDNIELLVNSIDELFYNQHLREKLSQNASTSVAHLSAESICKQWLVVAQNNE